MVLQTVRAFTPKVLKKQKIIKEYINTDTHTFMQSFHFNNTECNTYMSYIGVFYLNWGIYPMLLHTFNLLNNVKMLNLNLNQIFLIEFDCNFTHAVYLKIKFNHVSYLVRKHIHINVKGNKKIWVTTKLVYYTCFHDHKNHC